jgi:G:T-mismatch repair DNA endonuclease (very short patch repair protein)
MTPIKEAKLTHLIPIYTFDVCLLDGLHKKDIVKRYPSRKDGAYYLNKFSRHLQEAHAMTMRQYCVQVIKYKWPVCPQSQEPVGYKITGKGLILSKFKKGCGTSKEFSPKFKAFCDRMSRERLGDGNPMFGSPAWNKNTTDREYLEKMRVKRLGVKMSDASREKMRNRRRDSPIKARHCVPHSPEERVRMKLRTAKLWASGVFNRETSIEKKVKEFLGSLGLTFEQQYQVKYFCMDFAFPEKKIAIECQGTYFHIDPRIYPEGPRDAIQRRNFGRDKAKNKVCCDQQGWVIIEVWETEINDGSFKEYLRCKLQELKVLSL